MRRVVLALAISLAAASCSSDASQPTLPADLATLLSTAGTAMTDVETVHFRLERGGTPVYIFSDVEFLDAEGDYSAPDRAAAVAHVSAAGFTLEMGAIAIAGETWITNIITGDWEPATDELSIDPAVLFDPDMGLPELLRNDLGDAELVGLETRDGAERYHLRGIGPAARIDVITFGLVDDQDVVIDLWLDPVTAHVTEGTFTTRYRGEEATWQMTFSDYGEDVSIPIPSEING